jgi:hypothetical protein
MSRAPEGRKTDGFWGVASGNPMTGMTPGTPLSRTQLYLQNNEIGCIQGVSGLPNLAKLYLQGNYINHVQVSGAVEAPPHIPTSRGRITRTTSLFPNNVFLFCL